MLPVYGVGCHDVILVPEFACEQNNFGLFEALRDEIVAMDVFSLWHQDNHLIANDKLGWKKKCPTFQTLIQLVEQAFVGIKVNATRLNYYRRNENGSESKPYHHDRAAFTPGVSQNITICISLGATRTCSLKRTKAKFYEQRHPRGKWEKLNDTGCILNFDCPNGSLYAFARDVNIEWQHAVLPSRATHDMDRISVIVWGTMEMDVSGSRVSNELTPTARELGPGTRHHKSRRYRQ